MTNQEIKTRLEEIYAVITSLNKEINYLTRLCDHSDYTASFERNEENDKLEETRTCNTCGWIWPVWSK